MVTVSSVKLVKDETSNNGFKAVGMSCNIRIKSPWKLVGLDIARVFGRNPYTVQSGWSI